MQQTGKKQKHVHIIGICGKTTSTIAKMMKDDGWKVTGSDFNVRGHYGPPKDLLLKEKIDFAKEYKAENITDDIELVIVGGSAVLEGVGDEEVRAARDKGIKVVSYPEFLREFVVRENSIVVTGSYGKSTISCLLTWIFEKAGLDPSYMFSGTSPHIENGVKGTDSKWSVIEGDEYPAATKSAERKAKFFYYKPSIVLVTACRWDHLDIYPTEELYVDVFRELTKGLPKRGRVYACFDGKNVPEVMKSVPKHCEEIYYSVAKENVWHAENIRFEEDFTHFDVVDPDGNTGVSIETPLMGKLNIENVLGACVLALGEGIKPKVIENAVREYTNLKRRLEVRGSPGGVTVIDEFAHSPYRVASALEALRTRYKTNRLIAVYDAHSPSQRSKKALDWLEGALDEADEVVVPKVTVDKKTQKNERIYGKDVVEVLERTHPKVSYIPDDDKLVGYITSSTKKGDVVVFLSSSGWRGMISSTLRGLES